MEWDRKFSQCSVHKFICVIYVLSHKYFSSNFGVWDSIRKFQAEKMGKEKWRDEGVENVISLNDIK